MKKADLLALLFFQVGNISTDSGDRINRGTFEKPVTDTIRIRITFDGGTINVSSEEEDHNEPGVWKALTSLWITPNTASYSEVADPFYKSLIVSYVGDLFAKLVANLPVGDLPLPIVINITPDTGLSGDTIIITGVNFRVGSTVKIGNTPVPNVTYVSSTVLEIVIPAGVTSSLLKVVTEVGTSVGTPFTVTPVQTGLANIVSFSPEAGPVGTLVTITGTGFEETSAVMFKDSANQLIFASAFNYVSPTEITGVVPAGAVTATISIVNAAGESVSSTQFTVTV